MIPYSGFEFRGTNRKEYKKAQLKKKEICIEEVKEEEPIKQYTADDLSLAFDKKVRINKKKKKDASGMNIEVPKILKKKIQKQRRKKRKKRLK